MAEEQKEPLKVHEFESMVQYSTPVLVVRQPEKPHKKHDWDKQVPEIPGVRTASRTLTEKILHSILPPRCWEEDGQMWQRTVSTVPASHQEVLNLQAALDDRLRQCQARETGICPVRRYLYAQCLDEIVRQETINAAERGLLLLRIRNEINMSINSCESVFASAVAYGMRKVLQAHEEKEKLIKVVKSFEAGMEGYVEQIARLEATLVETEKQNVVLLEKEEQKFAAEAAELVKKNQEVKAKLDVIALNEKTK